MTMRRASDLPADGYAQLVYRPDLTHMSNFTLFPYPARLRGYFVTHVAVSLTFRA